jgi:cytochrome c biogenesis protein
MPVYLSLAKNANALSCAERILRDYKYRVRKDGDSISAEKGYLKESGNLVFHFSLIGVLIAVGIGGGLSFSGQRVLVEGDGFVNNLASYDAFSPGIFFDETSMDPFALKLDKFEVVYDLNNPANIGQPIDFIATVSVTSNEQVKQSEIRVNYPLEVPGASVYLTGNGFAPVVTVRDGSGNVAFSGPVVFLPQDGNNTSLGVIKVPDATPEQLGFIAFFYPTAEQLESGAYTSIYPDPLNPILTMNLYTGDLGLDSGVPRNVYALDTTNMTEVASRNAENPPLLLEIGDTVQLPENLGSVSFDGLRRYASLDIAYNPAGAWILIFALISLGSVTISLLVPRRRIWVKLLDEKIEIAALARSEDPKLKEIVDEFALELEKEMAKS